MNLLRRLLAVALWHLSGPETPDIVQPARFTYYPEEKR